MVLLNWRNCFPNLWSFGDGHIVHKLGYIWNHTPLGWLSKAKDGIISPWTHISECCSYIQTWNLEVGSNNTKLKGEGYWSQSKRVRSRVLSNLLENSLEDQQFSCKMGKIAFTFSYIVHILQHGSWYGYYAHAHHSTKFLWSNRSWISKCIAARNFICRRFLRAGLSFKSMINVRRKVYMHPAVLAIYPWIK